MVSIFDAFTKGTRVAQADRDRTLRLEREAIDRERRLRSEDLAAKQAATDRQRTITAEDLGIAQAAEDRPRDVRGQELDIQAAESNLAGAGITQAAATRAAEAKQIELVRSTSLRGINSLEQAAAQGPEALAAQFETLAPVFGQLGMSAEEVAEFRQLVTENPDNLAAIKAQFEAPAAKGAGALFQTKTVRTPQGDRLAKVFKDGRVEITDVVPTKEAQAATRLGQGAQRIIISQAPSQGAIAGAKALGKATGERDAEDLALSDEAVNTARVINTAQREATKLGVARIDDAISQVDPFNTGLVGGLLASVKGSEAFNLAQDLGIIRANEFILNLVDAKANGAAFGALSDAEGAKLESLRVALEQAQSGPELVKTLTALKDQMQRSQTRYNKEFKRIVGRGKNAPEPTRRVFNPATGKLE